MDEKMMQKLIAKSEGKPEMTDMEKQAKLDVIMELLEMAKADMGTRVETGMKELSAPAAVTVQAENPEDLEEGLEVASELTDKVASKLPEIESPQHEEKEEDHRAELARLMGAKRRV